MRKHVITSLLKIQEEDLEAMLYDSATNAAIIRQILDIICEDTISTLTWVRRFEANQYAMITSFTKALIKPYLEFDLWRYDPSIIPKQTNVFKVFSYDELTCDQMKHKLITQDAHNIVLYIVRCYHNYTDHFSFDINADYFNQLTFEDKTKLYQCLTDCIDLLMSVVRFHTLIEIKDFSDNTVMPDIVRLPESLQQRLKLTDLNVEYLRFIATGATAKEIAMHAGRSYRSVQGSIASLCEKLNCQNKNQLISLARIITSYIE
ncbi:helix-turn-helix transcriptional regulator [Cysteiniphilum sp. JM-1]|uniref:helix-turn-helix transcriptional regulator n=1 Tax=Cysteiniphilum sp. JM-1 TaxID=2610891 RepID=UPI0012459891|nr:helix-turn-helix transcriptional regulator [Cysteiniphilum sp. JM-1]